MVNSVSQANHALVLDPELKAKLDSLDELRANAIAIALLKKPLIERVPLYNFIAEKEGISFAVNKKIAHLFIKYPPLTSDNTFVLLKREELLSMRFDELQDFQNEYGRSNRFIAVENSDFAISTTLKIPERPIQLIPDLTLKIGNERFQYHSYLFRRFTHYFSSLQYGAAVFGLSRDGKSVEFDLTNRITKEELLLLVQYLYGQLTRHTFTEDNLYTLIKCSKFFQTHSIDLLDDFVAENLSWRDHSFFADHSPYKAFEIAEKLYQEMPHLKKTIVALLKIYVSHLEYNLTHNNSESHQIHPESFSAIPFYQSLSLDGYVNRTIWQQLRGMRFDEIKMNDLHMLLPEDGSVIGSMRLRKLKIDDCPSLTDQFLEHLSSIKELEELVISESALTSKAGQTIAKMPIKKLSLRNEELINSKFLKLLAESKTIEEIKISLSHGFDSISSKAAGALFKIPTLKKFTLIQPMHDKFRENLFLAKAKKHNVEVDLRYLHFGFILPRDD